MALVLANRVQETTITSGTGPITLLGAVTGFQSFAVIGNGNTCYYTIYDSQAGTPAWEVGIGTYSTTGPTLTRTTILSNSNGTTSPITLSSTANAKQVWVDYPAEKSINYDADGVATIGEPIGYADTGIIASFASTVAGYNQVIVQNKSSDTDASANINISNNVSTDTTGFAELGINSSTYVGTGSFSIPSGAYLASAGTDLTIGTYNANDIHFVTNSNTTDAMVIHDGGGIALGGLSDPGIGNIACNNINLKFQQIVTTGGTTFLTNASPYYTQFTGTNTQILQLPDATTCLQGTTFIFDNDSTQNVDIKDGAGTTFELLVPGGFHTFVLENNSTIAGSWLRYSQVPSAVEWGTLSLSLGATVITGGTWNGGTIQPGYGGTGLTTFTAANNALYSTGASTLTAGTLPVPAGGTGQVSFPSGYIPYGNTTAALQSSALLQFNGSYLQVGGGGVVGGATNPITAFSQSANSFVQTYVYNPNTGTSASADLVAYGDLGSDTSGFIDMGYGSSNYADAFYTVTGPSEGYILASAPSGAGKTGNLVYATDNTGTDNAHQWYVGGFTQAKSAYKMQLTSSQLNLGTGITRITGDFSNATLTNRVAFQTSTTNGNSTAILIPNGTSTVSGLLSFNNSDPTNASFGAVLAVGNIVQLSSGITGTGTYLPLTMYTGGSERLRIDTGGRVSIGNASPRTTDLFSLQFEGGGTINTAASYRAYGTSPSINFSSAGGTVASPSATANNPINIVGATTSDGTNFSNTVGIVGGFEATPTTGSHPTFFAVSTTPSGSTSRVERMRIDSSGNVGIGTSSPGDRLTVVAATQSFVNISNGTTVTLLGSGSGNTGVLATTTNHPFLFFTNNTERMRISAAGGLSVGTTSDPGVGAIYATGNITAFFSDQRLKTVSGKIENALDKVSSLSGVYYTMNDIAKSHGYDSDETQVGVLAQEVEAVLPEIVKAAPFDLDENGNSKSGENYKTVQYEKLVPLLIEAIKELREEIKELKAKVEM